MPPRHCVAEGDRLRILLAVTPATSDDHSHGHSDTFDPPPLSLFSKDRCAIKSVY